VPIKAKSVRPRLLAADSTADSLPGVNSPSSNDKDAIIEGLVAPQARVSPKYFYDALGSHLFEAITELPEYYPTRTERAIFTAHANTIAAATGTGRTLIDLGAGNCEKAARLFGVLRPARYVAIDISAAFLTQSLRDLRRLHPDIPMQGLAMDFSAELTLPETVGADRRLFFYPGSSLGNFAPSEALRLLQQVRAQCGRDGALLIGIDLVKDEAVLNAAYDDELGVTAAFNLNLLRHLNSLIGSDFKVREWRHDAAYNATHSRIEMHLAARRDLIVSWPGGRRRFAEGERIHTENSHKYRLDEFSRLLQSAGFAGVSHWTDEQDWFAVCLATVDGGRP
jgi:dimethylhistidine N-methyltransferase